MKKLYKFSDIAVQSGNKFEVPVAHNYIERARKRGYSEETEQELYRMFVLAYLASTKVVTYSLQRRRASAEECCMEQPKSSTIDYELYLESEVLCPAPETKHLQVAVGPEMSVVVESTDCIFSMDSAETHHILMQHLPMTIK